MDNCIATTKKGNPCKNKPTQGSRYCRVHHRNERTDNLDKIFADFVEEEFEKNQSLCKTVHDLDGLFELDIRDLYPEFSIGEEELLGYFNPFVSGDYSDFASFGQGSSILSLLPFYERIIVDMIDVPFNLFSRFYGVDFLTFNELVDSGRILPILPISVPNARGKDKIDYFTPLYKRRWPTRDRTFRLTQYISVRELSEYLDGTKYNFDKIIINASKSLFWDTRPEHQLDFIRLCKQAVYRGDPLLIFNWINLAKKYRKQYKDEHGFSEWAGLTIGILSSLEYLFKIGLVAPETSQNYSSFTFKWLQSELLTKDKTAKLLKLDEYNDANTGILRRLMAASRVITFEEISLLNKKFIHEPIEAVNDISKYLYWLEHSTNVIENQRIMMSFSQHLQKSQFKQAFLGDAKVIDEILSELNMEISMLDFDIKASRAVIQIGATFGSAVAAAALGATIGSGDLSSVFSICGAVAAATLTGHMVDNIVNKAGVLMYRNNAPFLLWKIQNTGK